MLSGRINGIRTSERCKCRQYSCRAARFYGICIQCYKITHSGIIISSFPSIRVPPTKPPISFSSSCFAFGSALYSENVSVVLTGFASPATNSDQKSCCSAQVTAFLLVPVDILICLSFKTLEIPPSSLFCNRLPDRSHPH